MVGEKCADIIAKENQWAWPLDSIQNNRDRACKLSRFQKSTGYANLSGPN
jgi:hypothetical protein